MMTDGDGDGGMVNGEVEASQESAKSIKAIDKTTVHRICSGQVRWMEDVGEMGWGIEIVHLIK